MQDLKHIYPLIMKLYKTSCISDSLNATGEEEKVKAIAAIEALKSPHGWDASADLRTLEEKAHLTPTITWKGKTASNDIVSDETNPNVEVHPPVADSTRVLKSTRTEPVFSASALPHEETSYDISKSLGSNIVLTCINVLCWIQVEGVHFFSQQ